jgi:hypothetical protein
MRYPAQVVEWRHRETLVLELDLRALAPGREPTLRAIMNMDQTLLRAFAQMLAPGHRVEVALITVDPAGRHLVASLSANPEWLTWNNGTVRQLAQRIRETGETVLFPVLADALEEAGCTERSILERCRWPQNDNLHWLVTLFATQE